MAAVKSVTVIGRRWFQRGPGNTYHTSTILIDGKFALKTVKEYGYGDQYLWTGLNQAETKGLIPPIMRHENGGSEATWQWAERNDIALHYEAIDVQREKDL